jgi:hypothetical protein
MNFRASPLGMLAAWGTSEVQHLLNPDMPWNERNPGWLGSDGTYGGKPADR